MSTFSTGVGLVSGFPIQDFVDAMMAVQRRPITLLQGQLTNLTGRRTALLQLSAQLLAIQNAATRFGDVSFFRRAQAVSSNESVMLATASPTAAVGQYTFTVRNLASTHQLLSAGFATRNATPIGAGTLTIESADALLNRATSLGSLNGGAGVPAGRIRVTDRAGNTAEIDLIAAQTIQDVVNAFNNQTHAEVAARIEGDHLVLEDQTGLAAGNLTVTEVGSGQTASALGLLGTSSSGLITGADLVFLSTDTQLDDLNDGNGVRRVQGQADFSVSLADGTTLQFDLSENLQADTPLSALNHGAGVPAGQIRLTNRAGIEAVVDLSNAATIGDVQTAIESAGVNFTVAMSGGALILTDGSTGDGESQVEDVDGGTTAQALGLVSSSSTGSIKGQQVYFLRTVGDVLRVINSQSANSDGQGGVKLSAATSPSGPGITLTDNTTGGGTFAVTALNGSNAAEDLGLLGTAAGNVLESRRLLAGLSTVLLRSLNGGAGVGLGEIQLTDRAGATAAVDLSNAETLTDVIAAINAAPTGITASISRSGLGIELTDSSGGTGNLVVADLTGTAAADLNIIFDAAANQVSSGNLQRQYVSPNTRLSDFNGGVLAGKFRITAGNGATAVVDLTQGNEQTLQDVIDEINSRGIGVLARINDTGDGLLLEDSTGGAGLLTVAEEGGTTARALRIVGTAAQGQTTIDGTLESRITVAGSDTLDSLLTKISGSGAPAGAAVINDGSSGRPYRLTLTSLQSGRDGALVVDVGTTGLTLDTLAEARDATIVFGSDNADSPLVLSSSSNTLSEAVSGVKLDLVSANNQPVTISVTKDIAAVVGDMAAFVSAFNSLISSLDQLTRFDPDTETRGILNGDATARRLRQSMLDLANRSVAGLSAPFNRLSAMGVSLSGGATLQLDEAKFNEALEDDPAAVEALFTTAESGFGALIQDEIERFTAGDTGIIPIQEDAIAATEESINKRISQMETLLERRRERLLEQFRAMEAAIAQMQTQQTALSQLATLSNALNSRMRSTGT